MNREIAAPSFTRPRTFHHLTVQRVAHSLFQPRRVTFAPCLVERAITQRRPRGSSHALELALFVHRKGQADLFAHVRGGSQNGRCSLMSVFCRGELGEALQRPHCGERVRELTGDREAFDKGRFGRHEVAVAELGTTFVAEEVTLQERVADLARQRQRLFEQRRGRFSVASRMS